MSAREAHIHRIIAMVSITWDCCMEDLAWIVPRLSLYAFFIHTCTCANTIDRDIFAGMSAVKFSNFRHQAYIGYSSVDVRVANNISHV